MSALKKLFPNATERPWCAEAIRETLRYGRKHDILSERCEIHGEECVGFNVPKDGDEGLILHAVNTYDARDRLLERAAGTLRSKALEMAGGECEVDIHTLRSLAAEIEAELGGQK